MCRCSSGLEGRGLTLDVLLDPVLLSGILNVHVLDAECAAVRVAQDVKNLVEGGDVAARQPVCHEVARQVPDRQPVGQWVELGVDVRWLGIEGIEVCDEVTAHAVHVDEGLYPNLLDGLLLLALLRPGAGVVVDLPADRLIGHTHRLEEVVVEAVGARQQGSDAGEEEPGLGALDDAMVVRRGERDDFAQAELGQHPGIGSLVARGVARARRPR